MHGPNAEFRKRILDKASLWIVFIAVFIAVIGFGLFGWQISQNARLTQQLITSGNRHHAETDKSNAEQIELLQQIKTLTMEVSTLQKEHSSDVTSTAQLVQEINAEQQTLAAAESKLSTAGTYIGQWDAWAASIIAPLCALSATPGCPAPPVPPPGL